MKKWYIYKNGNCVGQCDKLNKVFEHIEAIEGKPLTGWEVSTEEVKCGEYLARKEFLH